MPLPIEYVLLIGLAAMAGGYGLHRLWGALRARRDARLGLAESWGQPSRSDRGRRPVRAWWQQIERHEAADPSVDDRTWADLEMDDVFSWADRTLTAIGSQVLYAWLRQPTQLEHVAGRGALGEVLRSSVEQRVKVQSVLVRLGDRVGWDVASVLASPAPSLPLPLWAYRGCAAGLAAALLGCGLWPGAVTIGLASLFALLNPVLHVASARRVDLFLIGLRDLRTLVGAADDASALLASPPPVCPTIATTWPSRGRWCGWAGSRSSGAGAAAR